MAKNATYDKLLFRVRELDIDQTDVNITGGTISGVSIVDHMTTATDPALNAAVTTAIVDEYNGVVVTLTGAGNNQTLQNPTTAANIKKFLVTNNDTSTHDLSVIANSDTYTLGAGESQMFIWDGSKWFPTNIPITDVPVKVSEGGTGLASLTANTIYKGNGTSALAASSLTDDGTTLSSTNENFELAPSADPTIDLYDSDCADGDISASIEAKATDTTSGAEDVDVYFKQQVDGSLVSFMFADADGDLEISKDIAPQNRLLGKRGADVLSANDLSLTAGNYFVVTGTTQINGIATAGWTAGSRVLLEFASTPTVKHNTAASSGYASILVSGGADHVAVAGDIVEIIYNGTNWLLREIWSAS